MSDSDFPTALYGLAQSYEQELQKARTRIEQREQELLGHLDYLTKLTEQLIGIMPPRCDIDEQFNNLNLPAIYHNIYEVYGHLSRVCDHPVLACSQPRSRKTAR